MNQLKNFSKSDLVFLMSELGQGQKPVEGLTRNYYFNVVKYALSGIDESILDVKANVREKMQRKMQSKAQMYNLNPGLFMSDNVIAYNGGHPFEIYPYICLYVRRKNNKFYLELADFNIGGARPTEKVLKMFIAVRRAGINVALQDKDLLLKKMQNYNLKSR